MLNYLHDIYIYVSHQHCRDIARHVLKISTAFVLATSRQASAACLLIFNYKQSFHHTLLECYTFTVFT